MEKEERLSGQNSVGEWNWGWRGGWGVGCGGGGGVVVGGVGNSAVKALQTVL